MIFARLRNFIGVFLLFYALLIFIGNTIYGISPLVRNRFDSSQVSRSLRA